MAISFKRVPTVAVGDPVASRQINALAGGFNERLRSGLSETLRIFFYIFSQFRQPRNGSEDGLSFPSQNEHFDLFQFIEPGDAGLTDADPGDFEGANLSSVQNSFTYGSGPAGVVAEADRLTNPAAGGINLLLDGDQPAITPSDLWELAKRQRGAYDPGTGQLGSPAFTAARSFYPLIQSSVSPHNNAWGGFMPMPEVLGDCGDGDLVTAPHLNYKIFFTKLDPDATCPPGATTVGNTCEYPGTCPLVPGNVLGVFEVGGYYYVFLVGGEVDILSSKQFLQGPYQGGATLRKTFGGHLIRALNAWAREYRGSDFQRSSDKYNLENAFQFQEFLTAQYHLAPNVGSATADTIQPTYPLFRFSGSTSLLAGTAATHVQSAGSSYSYAPGTVLSGWLARATKLAGTVTITAYDGEDVVGSTTLTADADGNAEALHFLTVLKNQRTTGGSITPDPLSFKLSSDAHFSDASGTIEIECTQLLDYKPEIHDLYLVLRASGAVWNRPTDGIGIEEDSAKEIGQAYFDNGCVQNYRGNNGLPGNGPEVNSNGVYDAARRLSMFTRCVRRQNLVAYAVEDGKSVLWFKRYAFGLHNETPADMFQGIGPQRTEIENGQIKPGRTYVVSGESVTYDGETFSAGDAFSGNLGVKEFEGGGTVKEYEGIRAIPGATDESNEWLMGVQFKAYHTSESSLWKPDVYGDYFPLSNRCLFYSHEVEVKDDLVWQFGAGQTLGHSPTGDALGNSLILAPEAPSSYNYVHGVNGPGVPGSTPNFYKSCRIYEPDSEIESATVEIGDGGDEVVKLVFKTRFHHHASAPGSIDRDISTWNTSDLDAEDYRTIENGIRQYLVWAGTGANLSHKEGDSGRLSAVWGLPDNPFATVFPHFIFTKLVPTVYEDGNDAQNSTDTKVTHDVMTQMELYLRAMSEGCVDSLTSMQYACASGFFALYDYTFEALCFHAFGGRWIQTVATNQRDDRPQGFGPIPNVEMRAEVFNQFVECINLLTKFRVQLPMQIQCRDIRYIGEQEVRIMDPDGNDAGDFTSSPTLRGWFKGTPPSAGTLDLTGAFGDCSASIGATQAAAVLHDHGAGSGNWIFQTVRDDSEFTVTPLDPDAYDAIPEGWRDMISTNFSVLATKTTTKSVSAVREVALIGDASVCGTPPLSGFWNQTAGTWLAFDQTNDTTVECVLLQSGTIIAPELGAHVFECGIAAGGPDYCFTGVFNSLVYTPIVGETFYIEIPLS